MLYTYSTLMALILCVEIGLAVTIYIFKGDARDFVSKAMQKGMQNYDAAVDSEHAGVTETWNIIQVSYLSAQLYFISKFILFVGYLLKDFIRLRKVSPGNVRASDSRLVGPKETLSN